MQRIFLVLFILQFFLVIINAEEKRQTRYDFYRVYTIVAHTDEQLKLLQHMELTSDSYKFIVQPGKGVEVPVIVPPHKFSQFLDLLDDYKIKYTLNTNNLQSDMDSDDDAESFAPETEPFSFNKYYPVNTINNWLVNMSKLYSDHLELIRYGKSYKGRELLGVKLSYKKENPNILLDGGTHSCEWIAISVPIYVLNELLTSQDPKIRYLAENYNWYIFPLTNPDGYQYTLDTDKFWRKTVTPYGSCFGADPNRNWDIKWNTVENSTNPCTDVYPGPKPFSEIEMKSYSDYIAENLNGTLKLYISMHSYAQMLLLPYGYTETYPHNYPTLLSVGKAAVKALGHRYKTVYSVGSVIRQLYSASGSSVDWMYDKIGVPLAYAFELRPQFGPGDFYKKFKLPVSEILPTCKETLDSIVEIVHEEKVKEIFNN